MHTWIRCAVKTTLSLAVVLLILSCTKNKLTKASSSDNLEIASRNTLSESACDGSYMVVSTIDGKVSALDLHQHGHLAWSIPADSRPLVSSSLANLEVVRNGKKIRLIPSLDGAIYQFDGEKVEPIPMSAESLLSSTYQLSDDAMIVGSKSLQNFGVNFKTGEIQFICDSDGCNSNEGEAKDQVNGSDVVVVTRITQIVRSVDIKYKHGQEKWNFSVGEHQVSLPNTDAMSQIEDHLDEDELPQMFTKKKDKRCPNTDEHGEENFLRLFVPEGKVVALNKHDSSKVAWEHKFSSPIAKAWLLRKGKLHVMNLFTEQHIPTTSTFTPDDIESDSATQPLLYVGSHHKLLYIQPSPGMEAVLKLYSGRRIGHVFDANMKVAWKPYLNTASVRTPIFGGNRQHVPDSKKKDEKKPSNSLAVWHEEYPFDTGYFLYPEFRDSQSIKKAMLIEDLHQKQDKSLLNFFWSFKKEITIVIIFTILISLAVDYVIGGAHIFHRKLPPCNETNATMDNVNVEKDSDKSLPSNESFPLLLPTVSTSDEYRSRFATDFDCVQCLGKGGFGVVMEAVNKVDDQHYAVKRIQLPKSEGAKEKVLREVKALAKLEYIGIVRYFNAWVESPPAGWQEEQDLNLGLSDTSRQTLTNITASPMGYTGASPLRKPGVKYNPYGIPDTNNGLRQDPTLDTNTNTDSVVFASEEFSQRLKGSGSGEFTVHSNISESHSSSSDVGFELLKGYKDKPLNQSFSIEDEESRSCSRSSIPFSNYSASVSSGALHVDDEQSIDSVVFEQSKSLNRTFSENCNNSKHAGLNISLSFGGTNAEESEPKSGKHAKEQVAKYFLYIQMQLYQKETLKEWLYNNTLNRNRQELMNIFDQILCAVDYVHACGLMHRDLKPSNIFFSAEGVVKVGDFGLVTPLSVQEDEEWTCCDYPSSDGHLHTADVGTTLYMSPEQIERKPYNLKVDVFSLGLIFLELCMPFPTQMERVRTLQEAKKHVLPVRFERELPVECELVKRMTSKDPCQRPGVREIMEHSLLKDFAPQRSAYHPRSRTISGDSND